MSVLTAAYLVVLVASLSPSGIWQERMIDATAPFWRLTRMDQNWRLFSPQLSEINMHMMTILTFEDGTKMAWDFPRMERLSLFGRFKDEKFRKWAIDCLPPDKYKEFWPDMARFVGRKFYNPENKPVALAMSMWWADIPPPSAKKGPDDLPPQSKYCPRFEYRYAPGDFE